MREKWQIIKREGDNIIYHDGRETVTVEAVDLERRKLRCVREGKNKDGKDNTSFFEREMSRHECDETLRWMGVPR